MRLSLLLVFVSTLSFGQHTLININEEKAFEFGGQYATSSSGLAGVWAAYNAGFRLEAFVDKYTSSFSQGTLWGGRFTLPLAKQSEKLPINILLDTKATRFQSSGFGNTSYSGSGIISHQIKNDNTIISPYGNVGYLRFSSSGDIRWGLGADVQINKLVLGIEYGNTGGSGVTYFNLGYKFGLGPTKAKKEADEIKIQEEQAEQERLERERTLAEQEAQRQQEEQKQLEQQRLEQEQAEERRQEQRRLEQQKAEEEKRATELAEQQRLEQQKLEEERKEQLRMEEQHAEEQVEQENLEPKSQGDFSVQFFASRSKDKVFEDIAHLGAISIENVPDRSLYRYVLGNYMSREEAEKIVVTLASLGYEDAFVREGK